MEPSGTRIDCLAFNLLIKKNMFERILPWGGYERKRWEGGGEGGRERGEGEGEGEGEGGEHFYHLLKRLDLFCLLQVLTSQLKRSKRKKGVFKAKMSKSMWQII